MEATIQYIEQELHGLYPKNEVTAFVRLILENVCGLNYTEQVLLRKEKLDSRFGKPVTEIVARLKTYEPIQYILGHTEFFGLKLKVTPAVLIPRPETEELVQWITQTELPASPAILDIGTGSGCIALALKNQLPQATVDATDISDAALETAGENAALNGIDVGFFQADILRWEDFTWKMFDVIVSNPPYVRESEKEAMFPNVLKYEPESALFVHDNNPLLFYRRIAEFAQRYLQKNGRLFFEINENMGGEMKKMLSVHGFTGIGIKKDLFGKERMLRCQR
ncbi:peptide chain release factor N(5)-glutamine methyltransferase [Mariniphaga sediminis]|uniref:Release factor glutamine methyltransferase n=1 Tax=Mariniphaga sediminis TaxID=1628158 RepID=A0A399D4T2_9BACT|nr:peptide chain release factor N(5)-glutamine methyltransferase [Mariniphaga sediminis]RIH66423.1 peptide chain release factor N(5)-glutamine methyltransferase [Mariniphaga sediminis]